MIQTISAPKLYDNNVDFIEDTAGLVIKKQQFIPDSYISDLKRDKIDTLHTPTGDFYCVATVPTSLVEQWKEEGFDIMVEPARAILARLKRHDMDAFVTTNKRI